MKALKNYINKTLIGQATKVTLNPYNTFIIIKPGFTKHTDEILDLFRNNEYVVVKTLARRLDYDTAANLYKIHKDKDFYKDLCKYMSSGVSVGACLNYIGKKDPIKKTDSMKDDIRKTYGVNDEMKNVLHSSDSVKNVYCESEIYFK